jgi:hypothetical protein
MPNKDARTRMCEATLARLWPSNSFQRQEGRISPYTVESNLSAGNEGAFLSYYSYKFRGGQSLNSHWRAGRTRPSAPCSWAGARMIESWTRGAPSGPTTLPLDRTRDVGGSRP